jgi:hypothetical protein
MSSWFACPFFLSFPLFSSTFPSQQWLEKSASELVHEPPPMNKYSQMNTMNPDSQIGAKGAFYKLDNDLDNSDQESLMKVSLPLSLASLSLCPC